MPNFPNCKRKESRFRKGREVMRIEKKDLEGQQMRYRDIIDAQLIHAKDHMGRKAH